jgi:hypothetical protein
METRGEYNVLKVLEFKMNSNRFEITKTQIFAPIVAESNTPQSILNELLMCGHILHKNYTVDFSYSDPLILLDNTPIFQLISMS